MTSRKRRRQIDRRRQRREKRSRTGWRQKHAEYGCVHPEGCCFCNWCGYRADPAPSKLTLEDAKDILRSLFADELRARNEAPHRQYMGMVSGREVYTDPTMPPDRIDFEQDGRVVGRIVGLDWGSEPSVFAVEYRNRNPPRLPRPGEPCGHRGCLSHVTHPCEGCGRIAGAPPARSAPMERTKGLGASWPQGPAPWWDEIF